MTDWLMSLSESVDKMTDLDTFRAVLHVDPVVAMVPDTLDAEVVAGV